MVICPLGPKRAAALLGSIAKAGVGPMIDRDTIITGSNSQMSVDGLHGRWYIFYNASTLKCMNNKKDVLVG